MLRLLRDAAILSLPGEKIEQCSQRLADQAETDPEDHVSCNLAVHASHFLESVRDADERDLKHHASECNAYICKSVFDN